MTVFRMFDVLLSMLVLLALLIGPAQAQFPNLTTEKKASLEAIIKEAKKSGVQVIVVDPNQGPQAAAPTCIRVCWSSHWQTWCESPPAARAGSPGRSPGAFSAPHAGMRFSNIPTHVDIAMVQ